MQALSWKLMVLIMLLAARGALAVTAGAPPDSPSLRVDSNTADSTWAGVGSVIVDRGAFSGVVIGPRHVLTAGHVVGTHAPGSILFRLNFGANASHEIAARAVFRDPGFVSFNNPNLNDDLAIIELADAVPPGVPIYSINTSPIDPSTELTIVGYGGSGHGSAGVSITASATVKRVGKNHADALLDDDEGSGRKEVYLFDFDGDGAPNFLGGAGLGNGIEATLVGGDSGSPSFVQSSNGQWLVAGINTFVIGFPGGPTAPGKFGTGGGGQLISAYRDWIAQVVNTSNADIPASPDWPALGLTTGLLAAGLYGIGKWRRRSSLSPSSPH